MIYKKITHNLTLSNKANGSVVLISTARQKVSLCLVGTAHGWADGLILLGSSSIREGPFCDITMRLLILG